MPQRGVCCHRLRRMGNTTASGLVWPLLILRHLLNYESGATSISDNALSIVVVQSQMIVMVDL